MLEIDQNLHPQQTLRSCCGWLHTECNLDMFSASDSNGRTIDLKASFFQAQNRPKWVAYIVKGALLVWSIQVVISELIMIDNPGFWIAYLTHWGSVSTVIYFILSWTCLFRPISQDPVNRLTQFTWLTFTTTACVEIIITVLYWVLEYKKGEPLVYQTIMQHGVFMLMVMLDGFVINRIPVRFKQIVGFLVFGLIYMIWSGIHAAAGIGNPNEADGDPTTDDDAIYQTVSWNKRPKAAAVAVVGMLVVGTPLTFMFVWSLSTCGRRYLDYPRDEGKSIDIEAGSPDETSESEEDTLT